MKKSLILLVALALCALGANRKLPPTGSVNLLFDYPTNSLSADIAFQLYSSTNVALPLASWAVITNLPLASTNITWTTNGGGPGTNTASLWVQIAPGACFFVLTSSNFWGLSDFSNVTNTPPLPVSGRNLRAVKGL